MEEPLAHTLPRKRIFTRARILFALVTLLVFGLMAIAGIQAWEYTNSVAFCAYTCHDVHPEEIPAYQDSYHARVKCVECHLGRVDTLTAIALKTTHFQHLPAILLGTYERPLESVSMRPANESCERCHWPESFHDDSVREIRHYARDEANTETRTYLILHTGGGTAREGRGKGIHWHIENKVEYITLDTHKQVIPWVRVTFRDGTVREYMDAGNPISPAEIANAPKRIMDCVDCHNRMGHPFPDPERAVDDALATGRLDPAWPGIKDWAMQILEQEYASPEEAMAAVDQAVQAYVQEHPDVAAAHPDLADRIATVLKEIVERITFEEPGVTWRSFPNNDGHRVFPGCFRCHDGKHLSPTGESIRLHCNLCHNIPIEVQEGDRVPNMPIVTLHEPASHLETNFMADHRFQATPEECGQCHGEINFGADNSSFCANRACHGISWPYVELDAAFPHPIRLEGKHAEVWCHDCHAGVRRPTYVCANCHEPPSEPHFGDLCQQCHTPEGWKSSVASRVEAAPSVPHLTEGVGSCRECHGPGGVVPQPQDHRDWPGETCTTCHQAAAGAFPAVPHETEGMAACLTCHGVESTVRPAPPDHAGREVETCRLCHQPEGS